MNNEEKITISVNEEDVQNIINAYEKDIEYINQLEKENKELKRKLNEAIHKATEFESEVYELQKQLEEYENELGKADSIIQSCIFNGKKESEISYRKCLNMLEKRKNQQKEFIEYMNKIIKELECDDVDDEEIKGYLIQRIDTFKEILSKYNKIIGGKE